jgi:Glyoxalase superfamily protein
MMREYTVFNVDQCDGLQDNVARRQAGTTIVVAATLRHALKDLVFETSHRETIALIAKAFGYENWNILSAKIEAAERATICPRLSPSAHWNRPRRSCSAAPAAVKTSMTCAS